MASMGKRANHQNYGVERRNKKRQSRPQHPISVNPHILVELTRLKEEIASLRVDIEVLRDQYLYLRDIK